MAPLIEYFVDYIVPSSAESSINTALEGKIAEYFPFSTHLDSQNLTTLNISLSSDPVFTTTDFVFNLNVDAHETDKTSCGLQTHNIPFSHQGEVDAVVDIQIFQCILSSLIDSGALHNIVMEQIGIFLPLHDRMGIDVNFEPQSSLAIENGDFVVNIILSADFLQNRDGSLQKLITIADDQDVTLDLSLSEDFFKGIYLEATIKSLQSQLSSPFVSKELPAYWSSQIENSKWSQLSKQADEFLLKNLPSSFKYTIPHTRNH